MRFRTVTGVAVLVVHATPGALLVGGGLGTDKPEFPSDPPAGGRTREVPRDRPGSM